MILVLGAGLAGLSTAYHLAGRGCRVVEREREVGGLARSVSSHGFQFDFTGHLIHLRDPYVQRLCDELLGDDQVKLDRSAWVHYAGVDVPYPFQVNTAALPADVRVECIQGFAESLLPQNAPPPGELLEPAHPLPLSFLNVKEPRGAYASSFADWAVATFGRGFARHFFLQYNEKNFAADPATFSADWVSWAIPKPDLEDVLRGALGTSDKAFGYNPRFRYPRSGGIRKLPDALARRVGPVETGGGVASIDARRKVARLASGEEIAYDALVATNPLPELIASLDDPDPQVVAAAGRLRWCSVASFNFGLDRPLGHDRHWVYFPEKRFPFYRVGFPSNLTATMTPEGRGSICAEVAYPRDRFPPDAGAEERVLDALVDAGVLAAKEHVVVRNRLDLPFAYVLFDDARRAALPVIFRWLLERDVVPVGRYGSWSYLSMEDAILQGKEAAEYLTGVRP